MSTRVSRHPTNGVPEPITPIAELMSAFPAPWALCGGWAVDAWLGRASREHVDVDISVFVQDQQALFDHFAGWQLVAHPSQNATAHIDKNANVDVDKSEPTKRWDGRPLDVPGHIHGRLDAGEALPDGVLKPEDGFTLDIQLGDRSGDEWVLSREPRVSLSLGTSVQQSPWGLPTVVPEVLLFFKAQDVRHLDKLDFVALLPQLTAGQREWLREAISLVGHPWLGQLVP